MRLFFTTVAIWAVIGILAINGIEEMQGYRHKPIEQHVGDSTKDDIPMKGDDLGDADDDLAARYFSVESLVMLAN